MNMQGRPVWMIGRAMETGVQPKYLGLPDGMVHKRPMVIGTPHSGVIWVEGPFDVAALVQWGLDVDYRIIGLLGTAHAQTSSLTADCPPATPHYIALDQDNAGERAAQSMIVQMATQRVERVHWAGAKDCGDLLMLGKQGQDSFMRSIQARR
jgi:DNA primase